MPLFFCVRCGRASTQAWDPEPASGAPDGAHAGTCPDCAGTLAAMAPTAPASGRFERARTRAAYRSASRPPRRTVRALSRADYA